MKLPMSFDYSKERRIRRRPEILSLKQIGTRVYSKHFVLVFAVTQRNSSRLAVTVSKRVDKRAVERNRLKRVAREVFRLSRPRFQEIIDLHIIARSGSNTLPSAEIRAELLRAMSRARMLQRQKS